MPGADEVNRRAEEVINRRTAGLVALCDSFGKGTLEAYAKSNAPWTDRTTLARKGLHGGAFLDAKTVVTYIAHTMSYGVHLEKGKAGRYAILKPTMDKHKGELRNQVKRYWEGTQ